MNHLLAILLTCVAFSASGQTMTFTQRQTLRTAILADTDPVVIAARASRDDGTITNNYNAAASPTFVCWKTYVSITDIGDKINGSELAGLSSLNNTRLQTVVAFSASGINPSLVDRRQFWDDIFSGAGGVTTRAQLLALWKRNSSKAEKIFATGTGSDASPCLFGSYQGQITVTDVSMALNNQ